VKWTCERQEALLTDYQSRDLVSQVELALAADGDFLAFRGVNTSNVGAHAVSFIPLAKGVGVSTSACTTFPPPPCAPARCSATRRPRVRIAAPAARK
jgi:CO/xanthine dehydrogenase Mo-binding subunit